MQGLESAKSFQTHTRACRPLADRPARGTRAPEIPSGYQTPRSSTGSAPLRPQLVADRPLLERSNLDRSLDDEFHVGDRRGNPASVVRLVVHDRELGRDAGLKLERARRPAPARNLVGRVQERAREKNRSATGGQQPETHLYSSAAAARVLATTRDRRAGSRLGGEERDLGRPVVGAGHDRAWPACRRGRGCGGGGRCVVSATEAEGGEQKASAGPQILMRTLRPMLHPPASGSEGQALLPRSKCGAYDKRPTFRAHNLSLLVRSGAARQLLLQ